MPVLCCGAATALAIALRDSVLPENLVLLYLLLVITITIKIGRVARWRWTPYPARAPR